jgi:two-component system OmpR family sensor kinase
MVLGLLAIAAVLVATNLTLSRRIDDFLLDRIDAQLVTAVSRDVFRNDAHGDGGGSSSTLSEYYIAQGDVDDLEHIDSALADDPGDGPALTSAEVSAHLTGHDGASKPFTVADASGNGTWRVVAIDNGPGHVTVVALSLGALDATIGRIELVQVAGTAAVLFALGLVCWWMMRLGIHPLEDMAVAADGIARGDLSKRVAHPPEGTEAGRLGVALNAMLGRIEEEFHAREASEEQVRQFAADASHELRTPLTSILGYAELWRAGGLRRADQRTDAMARIESEAKRMAALVEDLLQLARLDRHRVPEHLPVRLDELLADAVRDAQAVEPARPITASLVPVIVEGDERQLRQVAANLLANVRVHTPADAAVHVAVTTGTEPDTVVLSVRDEGPGMSPEVSSRIFGRFYRADPSRVRSAGGSGLGLAIVEAITASHGGRVDVSSVPGAGSTFTVVLPGHAAAATPQTAPSGLAVPTRIVESDRSYRRLVTTHPTRRT